MAGGLVGFIVRYNTQTGVECLSVRVAQIAVTQCPNDSHYRLCVVGKHGEYFLTVLPIGSRLFCQPNQSGVTIATPLAILAPLVHLEGNQDTKHHHDYFNAIGGEFLPGQNCHWLVSTERHSDLVHELNQRHNDYYWNRPNGMVCRSKQRDASP